jgi:hypothetical protein
VGSSYTKVPREPEWLRKHFFGVDPGGKVTLLWEGHRLAIIRTGGSMCWSGQGRQSYHRSRTEVIYKDRDASIGRKVGRDSRLEDRIPPLAGRTKSADVAAMVERAKLLDAELGVDSTPVLQPAQPAEALQEFTVVFQAKLKVRAVNGVAAEASARQRILAVSRLDYQVVGIEGPNG